MYAIFFTIRRDKLEVEGLKLVRYVTQINAHWKNKNKALIDIANPEKTYVIFDKFQFQ